MHARMPRITFEEALKTLEGKGPVLAIAREVSDVLEANSFEGGIIGGIAVGLHGHARATNDVDVFLSPAEAERFCEILKRRGFEYEHSTRQLIKERVPVHIVTPRQAGQATIQVVVINGIRVASFHDLMNIKLRSGLANVTRAKDLGDVFELIQARQLTSEFASQLDKSLRADFRKLLRALARERKKNVTPGEWD